MSIGDWILFGLAVWLGFNALVVAVIAAVQLRWAILDAREAERRATPGCSVMGDK